MNEEITTVKILKIVAMSQQPTYLKLQSEYISSVKNCVSDVVCCSRGI